jgi:hypothetical protein
MAEGLDGAREAFQTVISPTAPDRAEPARDQSGRFQATNRAPEKMFEPRPVEGDPLTGDMRDGGEDARLATIERRVADGRAEEGDEDRLRRSVSDRARARSARRDGEGHQPAADEQERGGEQDGQGQDAQGTNQGPDGQGEQGDPDGNPEQDAEGESGPRYEVTVDGQTMEVTLPEALKGYIREQTFHQRMNKVSEARQMVEQEATAVGQARDAYIQRLTFLDRQLAELTPPEPNWDHEFQVNPNAAYDKQKAYMAIYGKRQQIANEMQRTHEEGRAEYDRNAQRYAVDQFTQFVREANIPDEKTLNSEMAEMRSYGKSVGFNEGELATVYDKRMLRVLRDAAKYNRAMAARPKAVIPGKGRTLTPGTATPVGTAGRRHIDEAQKNLAKTGRLDDAAIVFQRLIR